MRAVGWAVLVLSLGVFGSARADELGTVDEYRYLAVMSGNCDRFVVADQEVPVCADKLVNVDFGNGRVAFMFTATDQGRTVITTFSGGQSEQPDMRAYRLAVDRVSTTTVGQNQPPATVVAAAAGVCTMRGDPTHEPASFECRVSDDGHDTAARFRSVGAPAVYSGTRSGGPDALTTLAFRERWPQVVER
jgi:hypothetical protein